MFSAAQPNSTQLPSNSIDGDIRAFLLQALERLVADPADIQKNVRAYEESYRVKCGYQSLVSDDYKDDNDRTDSFDDGNRALEGCDPRSGGQGDDRRDDLIRDSIARRIIAEYAERMTFAGGMSSLAGVVPGLGTLSSTFGGGFADLVLAMKFDVEMVMAVAALYGKDITQDDDRYVCFYVAGLGLAAGAAKKSGVSITFET